MITQQPTKPRGGARPGAGRKPLGNRRVVLSLPKYTLDRIPIMARNRGWKTKATGARGNSRLVTLLLNSIPLSEQRGANS